MRLALVSIGASALLMGVLAIALAGRGSSGAPVGVGAGPFRGSETPARIRMPAFSLHDVDGAVVSSNGLTGKVVILTFLDTRCKEACPIIAGQLASTAALLTAEERSQVAFVAITSNPRVDDPTAVRAFLERHRALGTVHYLNGQTSTLRRLYRSFQILSTLESGDAETHSAPVRIYSRDGVWLATQHAGADLTPTNLAHDIRVALRR